jgi:hypothetical protein
MVKPTTVSLPRRRPGSALQSFSVAERVRWQNDLQVSYELIKDFRLTVTQFNSDGSKPRR